MQAISRSPYRLPLSPRPAAAQHLTPMLATPQRRASATKPTILFCLAYLLPWCSLVAVPLVFVLLDLVRTKTDTQTHMFVFRGSGSASSDSSPCSYTSSRMSLIAVRVPNCSAN
jgi:hypothetical protein